MICANESHEVEMVLDVNTQLYPMEVDDRFTCAIARTLNEDGQATDEGYTPIKKASLADKFDYVVYGKVYRCSDEPGQRM